MKLFLHVNHVVNLSPINLILNYRFKDLKLENIQVKQKQNKASFIFN